MKICLTGGIACGKSLLSSYLNEFGIETIDADEIVHGLIPPEERRRLAQEVFASPEARRRLEARIHPLVKARILERFAQRDAAVQAGAPQPPILVAVIPLLFEVRWDKIFDIICCVMSERATQFSRMIETRGYTRAEAEARLAAQLPVSEKAAKSHYVIHNEGTAEDLRVEALRLAQWLRQRVH